MHSYCWVVRLFPSFHITKLIQSTSLSINLCLHLWLLQVNGFLEAKLPSWNPEILFWFTIPIQHIAWKLQLWHSLLSSDLDHPFFREAQHWPVHCAESTSTSQDLTHMKSTEEDQQGDGREPQQRCGSISDKWYPQVSFSTGSQLPERQFQIESGISHSVNECPFPKVYTLVDHWGHFRRALATASQNSRFV